METSWFTKAVVAIDGWGRQVPSSRKTHADVSGGRQEPIWGVRRVPVGARAGTIAAHLARGGLPLFALRRTEP